MKILPVGANLFHAGGLMEREGRREGETDKDEANNRFSQIVESAEKKKGMNECHGRR